MEYRWYSKDKEIIWIHCRGTVIYDGEGSIRLLVGSISEVNGEEMRDRLTGLHGEGRFALDLGRLLQKKHGAGFLLLIGVDDFKEINEKYGIESGNTLLRELTDIIRECMLPGMQLYRLVADEFVLFGQDDMCSAQVMELFEKIRHNIFRHIEEEDYRNFYTVSGGLLQLPYPSADYSELVKYLEFALNEAKRRGKNALVGFSREDYDAYVGRLEIKEELLQWDSSRYGKMPPGDFIPVMEESGLIIPMGSYVMKWPTASACGCVWRVWKRKRSWCVYSGCPRITFRDFYSAGPCRRGNL